MRSFLICYFLASCLTHGYCDVVPVDTFTSSQGVSIVKVTKNDDSHYYAFWDEKNKKQLSGPLFAPDFADTHSNIDFEADWSPSGNRVMLVTYYGSKSSCFDLFQRDKNGNFQIIPFKQANALTVYKAKHGKAYLFSKNPAVRENILGPWSSDDDISLITGYDFTIANGAIPDDAIFIKFHVTINNDSASVKDITLINTISGDPAISKYLHDFAPKFN